MFNKLKTFFKQITCNHSDIKCTINPFVDEYGNHSAIYECTKCGCKAFKTFEND